MNALLGKELKKKSRLQAEKLSEFVELRNNRYCLNLSEEECRKIGISRSEYRKIVSDLEETNRFVHEVENKSGQALASGGLQSSLLADRMEGTIYTSGQEVGTERIQIPAGYRTVRFTCRARAALVQFFMCKIEITGGVYIKNDWEPFWKNTVIDIPLKQSNCGAVLGFQTMDSNGGFARWKLLK